ncbi:P-loop containing nucleoside triphosphate hydrolase protein [Meredithblackwellia eburnea MCA 4105]
MESLCDLLAPFPIAIALCGSLAFSTLSNLHALIRIFSSDDNVVVSAPTGSGKTVLFELAILRLFSTLSDPDAKVVYMAPTKSLCSERARDWKAKFTPFGWKVVEYTGDSSLTAHREVAGASVIITTPEKWDSMTRRWNSFKKTLDTFRLFLIDECHFVGMDTRGAVLEVVVARMKTLGTRTRFLALSATAPNIEDVAEWIGSTGDDGPAKTFAFGEEYRACPLQKIVVGYPKGNMNDFVFNNTLNGKLFDLIKRHADRKPVLIFCNTRKGCLQAAEALAKEYRSFTESSARAGPWPKPARNVIKPGDKSLANLVELGIAFHHAGLDMNDRRLVEQSFIDGGISVVCCTSTLAVGVNLPCRMVIIKGTQSFADGRFVDYSDLDLIQMMGRAGRPQFDHTGVVLILTDKDQEQRFNSLVKSETLLESCLHRTLTEHINSEITLGNIDEISSALRWLRSSFLYVRIRKNPSHYAISGDETTSPDLRLEELCLKSIEELVQEGIVMQEDNGALLSTDYGDIMSRYYLSHETFLLLKAIPPKATMRALLETLSACSEFASIRFRSGEKQAYTAQNKILKYPCTKVQNNTDKICILIQLVLQCIPLNEVKTNDGNPTMEVLTIWTHLSRLVKAIVDIGLERKDGGVKTALELLRSVNAKAWDGSPFVLRQLDGIGEVSVKALSERGILSFQDVCDSDPSRIEVILNRNPPFGRKIVAQATALPKFFVNLESKAESPSDSGATIDLEVEIGLVYRDPPPTIKKSSRFFASVLLVTSDFEYIEFRRMMSDHLLKGPKSFSIRVNLVKPSQRIIALVACDDLGGSEVKAVHKPAIHSSLYPLPCKSPFA